MSKDRTKVSWTPQKLHEEELQSLKSVRAMLTSLQLATERIRDDIASAIDNYAAVKGKHTKPII